MEFALPVRVRWDIDYRGVAVRTKRVARSIREAGPLALELRIHGPTGRNALGAVVTEMQKGSARLQVGVRLFPGADELARWGYPVRIVWEIEPDGPFSAALPPGAEAMSFCPDDESIGLLPEVLADFAASPVPELRIPNVNAVRALAARGHVPVPAAGRIAGAVEEISRLGLSLEGKRLVVHDYFLWQALREKFPGAVGERVEFSGCQAATSLAYVDWEGNVYPCDSLPVRLGNLLEAPLAEIWGSPTRRSLAASIGAAPGGCGECGAYPGCLAGCRGLAFTVSGTLDAADPGCPGPGKRR